MIDRKTKQIICTSYQNGKCHDYRLFKESKVRIQPKLQVAVDTGCQGVQKIHVNTVFPKKKSKKHPLSPSDRKNNTELAKERVVVEHVKEC